MVKMMMCAGSSVCPLRYIMSLCLLLSLSETVVPLSHNFISGREDYCHGRGATRIVADSLQVNLSKNPLLFRRTDFRQCDLTLRAPRGYRLLLSWTNFHMNYQLCSGFSSRARCAMMKIYDPKQSKIFDWTDDLMGAFRQVDKRTQPPMADVSSRGRGLLIQYQGYPFYDSVSMVFTAYKDPIGDYMCNGNLFLCEGHKTMCIPFSLVCNGENNCGTGNRFDETNIFCYTPEDTELPATTMSQPVGLIGALAGSVITTSLVATFGITVYLLRKRRQRLTSSPTFWQGYSARGNKAVPNVYVPLPVPAPHTHHHGDDLGRVHSPHSVPDHAGHHAGNGHLVDISRHFMELDQGVAAPSQPRSSQRGPPLPLQSTGPVPPPRADIDSSDEPQYINVSGESTLAQREQENFVDVPVVDEQYYVNVAQREV